ncbi:MAG: glycosyltransferase family 39 protein [Bacteroidota bacterium]
MRKRINFSRVVILLTGLVLFSCILAKASVSSFTHDESFSYLRYVSHSFMDLISNKDSYANNHVLNTLLMKYSEKLFGSSEISLRLPNVLMTLVYFVYAFLLLHKQNRILAMSVFIVMAANTALTDFFGLARGYGLSVGFMIMSLYHLIQAVDEERRKHLLLFNLAALLAILSNFTLLTFYIAGLFAFNLCTYMQSRILAGEKFNFFRTNKINIASFFVLLIVLYEPVRKAVKFNAFDFGGKRGFVSDTVTALIQHMVANIHLNPLPLFILQAAVMIIVAAPLILVAVHFYRADKLFFADYRAMIMVSLIFPVIAIETIVQHYLLKTDYPVGRFALFLLPLLILDLGFLCAWLLKFRSRYIIYPFIVSLAVFSASNFYLNRDLFSCAEWNYDSETKNAVNALILDHVKAAQGHRDIKVGINWLFEPAINYYRVTRNLAWLLPVDRDGLTERDDYEYIFRDDLEKLKNSNYKVIFSSDRTNTVLIRLPAEVKKPG